MKVGQRVECINDRNLNQLVNPIKKGNEYTIRYFYKGYRPEGGITPMVYLEEIKNIIFLGHEIGYDANRFRELPDENSQKSTALEQVHKVHKPKLSPMLV